MPRPVLPPAMKDPLLAAVMAKLPAPGTAWPIPEREAWFDMFRKAVEVAYGPVERMPKVPLTVAELTDPAHDGIQQPRLRRYVIDHDGFAMCDGRPIDPGDLPADAILWDERTGIDHGNTDAIMWKTGGSNKQRLPAGVQIRAAQGRHANGEAMT